MKKTFTKAEVRKMARDAKKWIESPEGEAALKKSMKEAMETITELNKGQEVTWEQMHRPINFPR